MNYIDMYLKRTSATVMQDVSGEVLSGNDLPQPSELLEAIGVFGNNAVTEIVNKPMDEVSYAKAEEAAKSIISIGYMLAFMFHAQRAVMRGNDESEEENRQAAGADSAVGEVSGEVGVEEREVESVDGGTEGLSDIPNA